MKIKKGDQIIITLGKDRGKKGKVEQVFAGQNKVLVPGLNIFKKHIKKQNNQEGGVIDFPRPLVVSKVALICPKCNKPTRIGFEVDGKNKEKHRLCKKCHQLID